MLRILLAYGDLQEQQHLMQWMQNHYRCCQPCMLTLRNLCVMSSRPYLIG